MSQHPPPNPPQNAASGAPLKVLIIEDESEIREFLVAHLQDSGMEVVALATGDELKVTFNSFVPDVVLLDQVMPGKSGREIIREIRSQVQFSNLPIMMVTGLDGEADKVETLADGADDYMTKPFSVREIVARINALVRRSQAAYRAQQRNIRVRDLDVDLVAHRVTLKSREIPLTLTEFKILVELLRQCGQVLTRDRLREHALGNLNVADRTIDVHMASLRKKLDEMGDLIETVRGVGYRMAP
ncbi:MAG: DNA-binding response regulator [Bdellovibrio sp.]|nr:MAG: DNA-binding response regulator [Bdellovibrio sp.]